MSNFVPYYVGGISEYEESADLIINHMNVGQGLSLGAAV